MKLSTRNAAARRATSEAATPAFLTPGEVAELLRTTRSGVYAMVARGTLPGVTRVGRRLLIRREDLIRWLDEKRALLPEE